MLFSLVGVFTWITFYLSAAPFYLSTTALSSLFFVYLIGLIVTPAAGYLITRVGLRAGIGGAICLLHRRRAAHARSLAPGRRSRPHHAFQRRLHRANCIAKPSARRGAVRRTRHRCRHLHHLLLPRRNRCRRRSRSFLGSRQMAGLRRLHRCHAIIALAIALIGWRTPVIRQSWRADAKCRIVKHSQQSVNRRRLHRTSIGEWQTGSILSWFAAAKHFSFPAT